MGGLQVCSSRPNGVIAEDRLSMSSTSSSSPSLPLSNPDPSSFDAECWARAEQTTQEIVCRIQPTMVADQKRKEVIDYIQRLIRSCLGYEVFPYGSVPLKTYLPDGDIDLTALSSPSADDALASDIHAVLEDEEQNEAAEYKVKDVQFIDAEVKLVKCLVQNIVVDISFNQLGGLCTLCFLEQVDRLIGKDHLFKRSIILIKAWCYYESRILGAHHGLISTYALETLVLYIFHQFHTSLNGPLAVLYKFLDYFSKFDWENYCISLNGPVCKSSLPDIIAEVPKNDGNDLLLSGEFLKNCVNMFSVQSRGLETNYRAFPQKHLNIIDPLKENNNLGRSVHRGNFHRIRSAFKFGACKLGQILMLPRENIADELNKFFKNTLERHGSKCRGNVQDHVPTVGARGSWPSSSSSCAKRSKMCSEDNSRLLLGFSDNKISEMEDKNTFRIRNNPESSSMEVVFPEEVSESDCPADGNEDSRYHLSGNAKEPETSGFLGFRTTNDMSDCSPSSSNLGTSLLWNSQYTNHFNVVDVVTENGKTENGQLCKEMPANSVIDGETGSVLQLDLKENHLVACNSVCLCSNHEGMTSNGSAISNPEVLNSLLDLSGDNDSHIRSLLYGQRCHGYALSALVSPSPPLSPSQSRNRNRLDTIHRYLQFKGNFHSQMNTNGAVLRPPFYPLNHPTLTSTAITPEEKQKPRGIGTYFPNTNYRLDRDRSWPCRERNQASGTNGHLERHTRNNGLATASPETNSFEEGSRELSQAHYPVLGRGKSGSLDFHQSHPSMQGSSLANGFSLSCNRLEFGSIGHLPLEVPSSEVSSHSDSGTPCTLGSTSSLLAPAVQDPRQVSGNSPERITRHLYHLKDEDDFPPLSL